MADTKATALSAFTPISTDLLYGVDDPGGTPVSGKVTFADLFALAATSTLAAGTLTASAPMTHTQTWNNAGVTFVGKSNDITSTASAAASLVERWRVGGSNVLDLTKSGQLTAASTVRAPGFFGGGFSSFRDQPIGFTNGNDYTGSMVISMGWVADGVMGLGSSTLGGPGSLQFHTYGASPPAAPAASKARLYADTSGGKIRLMVIFPSGAAQQMAIEP